MAFPPDTPPSRRGHMHGTFWTIFEQSRIPMSLIDENRRYVAVNDATVEFYGFSREDILAREPGSTLAPEERVHDDADWEKVRTTGELYKERVVKRADGRELRIRYVIYATTASGRWRAFVVLLSAREEPDGPELIAPAAADEVEPGEPRLQVQLTERERQIIHRIALGASSRDVAAELYLSPETIRSHVRNAMSKTRARTRAQLVAIALAEGLLENE